MSFINSHQLVYLPRNTWRKKSANTGPRSILLKKAYFCMKTSYVLFWCWISGKGFQFAKIYVVRFNICVYSIRKHSSYHLFSKYSRRTKAANIGFLRIWKYEILLKCWKCLLGIFGKKVQKFRLPLGRIRLETLRKKVWHDKKKIGKK